MTAASLDASVVRIDGQVLLVGDDADRVAQVRPLRHGLIALYVLHEVDE